MGIIVGIHYPRLGLRCVGCRVSGLGLRLLIAAPEHSAVDS